MPASLLPRKTQYQRLANSLPPGHVLIVLPARQKPQRTTMEKVAAGLRAQGHRVTTLPAERLA